MSTVAQDLKNWFVYTPENEPSVAITDMANWLDKPAGKHGFVQMKGDHLVFEDGTPIKLWGTNLCSDQPFMKPEDTVKWSNFLSRFDFNGVRFHEFTWGATVGIHSTVITDERWKNFAFLFNELRNKGIYYGWSHIYGHRVMKADSDLIPHNYLIKRNKTKQFGSIKKLIRISKKVSERKYLSAILSRNEIFSC